MIQDPFELEIKLIVLEELIQLLTHSEKDYLMLIDSSEDPQILKKIFQTTHHVTSHAKVVGFDFLSDFTRRVEFFLVDCQLGVLPLTTETISLLLKCYDHIHHYLQILKKNPFVSLKHHHITQKTQELITELYPSHSLMNCSSPQLKPTPPQDFSLKNLEEIHHVECKKIAHLFLALDPWVNQSLSQDPIDHFLTFKDF